MSLSRLLSPRLRPLINSVECRRWRSSMNVKGESSQPLKKSEVVEQQKSIAAEISEKKHMTENEGVFPREKHVQKEEGPWYNLLSILQTTKKKIFGNFQEPKSSNTHALTSTSDLKDSDNVVSADSHDSGSMNNLKITIHSEKTSITNMEENVDKSKASEVVIMKNTSNSVGPEELLKISSKECEGSTDYGVNGMPSGASSICGKANSDDAVQLINDFREFVKKEREQLLAEEALSSVQISSGEEIPSKAEEACIVEHQMQIEMPRTSHRASADKSGSTAPENQQEDVMELCKFSSNLELGRSNTSDSSCISKRVASLVDVPQEKRNNEPKLEAKTCQFKKKGVMSDIISIFEDGTSSLKQGAYSNSFLQSEATNKWRDVLIKESVLSANEHHPSEDISIPISLSNTKMDEISSVSYNSSHMEADHGAIDQIVDPKSEKSVPKEVEHLNETSQNTFEKSGVIKSLIACIGELPPQDPSVVRPEEIVVDGSVDRYGERSASNSILAQTDKLPLDGKNRKASSQGVTGKKENSGLSNKVCEDLNPGDERTEIGKTAPHGFCKSMKAEETTSLRENGNLNKSSDEKKMTIKFLNVKATESDVTTAFKDLGTVRKVVFPSVKSTKYKVAHIYFKLCFQYSSLMESKKGIEKARKRSDVNIMNAAVLEERMRIPDLIGYPDVPKSLVKHPSRTVVIENLNDDLSFDDIEEALAFCKSNITGIFFGSSGAVAYVEFETVEGKEIAIEKHSLIVHGEKLSIFRIDAPRTTIVRISNVPIPARRKVLSFCKKLGKTVEVVTRTDDIMDVHYELSEWPKMLEIVNRLNGFEVDGQPLVAKPAPVYPPHILDVLWSHPEGRKHLKTVFNSMLLKVSEDTVSLTELVDNFYADVQEI